MKKVYVVYRIYNENGESAVMMKIFSNRADAENYHEMRKTATGFYWDILEEKEVV